MALLTKLARMLTGGVTLYRMGQLWQPILHCKHPQPICPRLPTVWVLPILNLMRGIWQLAQAALQSLRLPFQRNLLHKPLLCPAERVITWQQEVVQRANSAVVLLLGPTPQLVFHYHP